MFLVVILKQHSAFSVIFINLYYLEFCEKNELVEVFCFLHLVNDQKGVEAHFEYSNKSSKFLNKMRLVPARYYKK